jgi:flagellar basal-body rod protein FlgF
MDKGIYTAVGSINAQRLQETNAIHELANVSTVGFKKAYQIALQSYRVDGDGFKTRFLAANAPSGVVNLTPGSRIATGNAMDIFMNDKTLLGVQNEDGQVAFTRRGDIRVNQNGELALVTGQLVLDDGGVAIVPPADQILSISDEGVVYAVDPDQEVAEPQEVARLMLRDASDVAMEKMKDGLFKVLGQPAGDFETGPNPVSISSGQLEGSAANAMETMVKMMNGVRSFEMKMKLVKELGDLGDSNNSLMRLG